MNEQYAKHLIKQHKNETPMQLWMQFVGMQLLFGFGLIVALFIVFGVIEIIANLA
tara:strand:- start:677 stop:841 length:165 start_codon:yes stop_codon:yes gene_type:complete